MRERDIIGGSHVQSYVTPSVLMLDGLWVYSLLSLAFATRWNPKYSSHLISVLPLISAGPQISAASLGIHIEINASL